MNYQAIPANCPLRAHNPFQRDGAMAGLYKNNYGSEPNYTSSLKPLAYKQVPNDKAHEDWVGKATAFSWKCTENDYAQAEGLWHVLGRTPGQQDNFVHNVSVHLCDAKPEVREKTFQMFDRVNKDLGLRLRAETAKTTVLASKL